MSNQLLQGSHLTDTLLSFPPKWTDNSRAMVKARNMTQADIDDVEARLLVFRRKRDTFKAQSFEITIPKKLEAA